MKGKAVERRRPRSARVGKAYILKAHLAPGGLGKRRRPLRRADGRPGIDHFGDAGRGARGFLDLAPDLGEILDRIGREESQGQKLHQVPERERLLHHHGHGGLEQQADHAAEDQGDHQGREQAARLDLGAGRFEGLLHGRIEPARHGVLLSEGLDRIDGSQSLAGMAHRLGEPVLCAQGETLQPPTHQKKRCEQGRNQEEDNAREVGADNQHPAKGAHEGDQIA